MSLESKNAGQIFPSSLRNAVTNGSSLQKVWSNDQISVMVNIVILP